MFRALAGFSLGRGRHDGHVWSTWVQMFLKSVSFRVHVALENYCALLSMSVNGCNPAQRWVQDGFRAGCP